MIYLIGYRLSDGNVGLAVRDGAFTGSEDIEQTKTLLPNYNGYHAAGLTWSTSATIYWMQYRPCVFEFNDLNEVEDVLLDKTILRAQGMAGSATYTLLKPEYVGKVAFDPKLIDEGLETAKPFWEK